MPCLEFEVELLAARRLAEAKEFHFLNVCLAVLDGSFALKGNMLATSLGLLRRTSAVAVWPCALRSAPCQEGGNGVLA